MTAQRANTPTGGSDEEPDGGRLDSWKDIAAYVKRDVSTVQRWEKREGMPVHRHLHERQGSVYAFKSEIDAWMVSRSPASRSESDSRAPADPGASDSRDSRIVAVVAGIALVTLAIVGTAVLIRPHGEWQNPLASARFRALTDFDGNEFAASVSRDGHLVAFLSDRDGPVDVWLTPVGTVRFHNLTRGAFNELVNPSVRTTHFSADGASVAFWRRKPGTTAPSDISIWSAPTGSNAPQLFLEGAAEVDWSHSGKQLVYHTAAAGDPMFIRNLGEHVDRALVTAPAGLHAHFPVWSPDDRFIYFVQGKLPDAMDVWRIPAAGGPAERVTFQASRVSHPAFLDNRTLLYLATEPDGAGPWLYGLDLQSKQPRRLNVGSERYTSLSASGDGRRLVATVARTRESLWRIPITTSAVTQARAQRVDVQTPRAVSPRFGPGYLLFVSVRANGDAVTKIVDGRTTELWTAPEARIVGAPAISPDGGRITFVAHQRQHARLFAMDADGSNVRVWPMVREPRGAPAWAPDGRSIAVADAASGEPRVVRLRVDNGDVSPLVQEYSTDPAWSPDGQSLVYSGADIGTTFRMRSTRLGQSSQPPLDLTLTRGERRVQFVAGGRGLIILRGEIEHKNFWWRDLDSGSERPLTNFDRTVTIRDFDVSPDGSEIVFDRVQENSDLVLVDIP